MHGPVVVLTLLLLATGCSAGRVAHDTTVPEPEPALAPGGIGGTVADVEREPLPNALVILQSRGTYTAETTTNVDGRWFIPDVPAGTYVVQVLYGETDVSKVVVHDGTQPVRANFSIDPTATRLCCCCQLASWPIDRSLFDDDRASDYLHQPRVIRRL